MDACMPAWMERTERLGFHSVHVKWAVILLPMSGTNCQQCVVYIPFWSRSLYIECNIIPLGREPDEDP